MAILGDAQEVLTRGHPGRDEDIRQFINRARRARWAKFRCTMRMRHPSPAARVIRNNPAPTTKAPMARATRSPATGLGWAGGRALSAGEPLGARKRVGLRDDPAALALSGFG
jgi:hypothetical protein